MPLLLCHRESAFGAHWDSVLIQTPFIDCSLVTLDSGLGRGLLRWGLGASIPICPIRRPAGALKRLSSGTVRFCYACRRAGKRLCLVRLSDCIFAGALKACPSSALVCLIIARRRSKGLPPVCSRLWHLPAPKGSLSVLSV